MVQLKLKDYGASNFSITSEDESIDHLSSFLAAARAGQVRQAAAHLARIIPAIIEEISSLRDDLNEVRAANGMTVRVEEPVVEEPSTVKRATRTRTTAKKASSRKATKVATPEVDDVTEVNTDDEVQD